VARLFQRLLVLLAFAGVILVPARARAAICTLCEAHDLLTFVASAASATSAPPAETCMPDAGAPVPADAGLAVPCEDPGDLRVPALCDNRGASMIAPPRVLPVADARIEAVHGCASELAALINDGCGQRSHAAIGPGPRHSPVAGASPVLPEHAVLDAAGMVPPASSELGPDFPPVTGGPLHGVARGIDHPPRAA
jgi:hypothetical protein